MYTLAEMMRIKGGPGSGSWDGPGKPRFARDLRKLMNDFVADSDVFYVGPTIIESINEENKGRCLRSLSKELSRIKEMTTLEIPPIYRLNLAQNPTLEVGGLDFAADPIKEPITYKDVQDSSGCYAYNRENGRTVISLAVKDIRKIDDVINITLGFGNTSSGLKDVFRHELGHHIYDRNEKAKTDFEKIGLDKKEIEKVSIYSLTSNHELFAESFSIRTHPQYKKGMLPKPIEEFFDRYTVDRKKKDLSDLFLKHLPGKHGQQSHAGMGSSKEHSQTIKPEALTPALKKNIENEVDEKWQGALRKGMAFHALNFNEGNLHLLRGGKDLTAIARSRQVGNDTVVSLMGSKQKGYGTKMLQSIVDDSASKGLGVSLTAIDEAVGFYEKSGMRKGSKKNEFYFTADDCKQKQTKTKDIDLVGPDDEPEDGVFVDSVEQKSSTPTITKAKPKITKKPLSKEQQEFVFRETTSKFEKKFQKTMIDYFKDQEKAALSILSKGFEEIEQKHLPGRHDQQSHAGEGGAQGLDSESATPYFHGSTVNAIEKIRKEGLISEDERAGERDTRVFLSTNERVAKHFAELRSSEKQGKPILLEVHIPKDREKELTHKVGLNDFPITIFPSKIPPEWIGKAQIYDGEKWSVIEKALKDVNLYAVILVKEEESKSYFPFDSIEEHLLAPSIGLARVFPRRKKVVQKGGPGSGSWDGPGDPRFAHEGISGDASNLDESQLANLFLVQKRDEPPEGYQPGVGSNVYRSTPDARDNADKAHKEIAKLAGTNKFTVQHAIMPTLFGPFNDSYAGTGVVLRVSETLGLERSSFDIQRDIDNTKKMKELPKKWINQEVRFQGWSKDARVVPDEELDKIVKATYETTQKLLKDNGIESITVYRGMTTKRSTESRNVLESWTAEKNIAERFAQVPGVGGVVIDKGYVESKTIPAKNIFAVPGSGWGVNSQLEVIVLNDAPRMKGLGDKHYEEVMNWERWLKEGIDKEDYLQSKKSLGLLTIFKGGPGSGNYDGPGQPRFAHEGKETEWKDPEGNTHSFEGLNELDIKFVQANPYLFHVTENKNTQSISLDGIKPSKRGYEGPGVYFGTSPAATEYYISLDDPDARLFRIRTDDLLRMEHLGPNGTQGAFEDDSVIFPRKVPPELLEFRMKIAEGYAWKKTTDTVWWRQRERDRKFKGVDVMVTKASPNALPDRFDFSGWAYKNSEWNRRLQTEGGLFIKEVYEAEGKRVWDDLSYQIADGLDGAFDIDNPLVQEFIENYSYKFAQGINETTVASLQAAMSAGTSEGLGMDGIAKLVRDVFDNCTKYRSQLIARTETIRASNGAAKMAYEQSEVVEGMEWLVTADDRLCSWCSSMSGKTVGLDENFFELGDKLTVDVEGKRQTMKFDYEAVGYPPLHPACRCAVIPVVYAEYEIPKSIGLDLFFKHLPGQHNQATHAGHMVSGNRESLPDHIKALKIPPAWTDLQYNEEPEADLLVTGIDKKGKMQYIYSERFQAQQAAEKFERIKELTEKYGSIHEQNEANIKDPVNREKAECLDLIMETGIRPGSDADTHAEKKAYGATTLLGKHVKVAEDGSVSLQFVGKKGVDLDIPVQDSHLKAVLVKRAKSAGEDGKLFDVDDAGLRDYTHTLDGGNFKPKDFRTRLATETAVDEVKKFGKTMPTNEKEYKKMVKTVATVVSKKLGNTPVVALSSYIYPGVFSKWRASFELKKE